MSEITRAYRHIPETLTVQRGDISSRKIRGVASVYYDGSPGTEYGLGEGVVERIAPGAFDALLKDDVICCYNHDPKLILGRNGSNMKLWTTPRGLEYEVDLADTSCANDMWQNIKAGIIVGSSFKAELHPSSKSTVEWSREGKTDVMTRRSFKALMDVSPVSDAAYKSADVQAVKRSLAEHETAKRLARAAQVNRMNHPTGWEILHGHAK